MEAVKKAKMMKALALGSVSSVIYLFVYIVRNTLSAIAPQMIENGIFTTEVVGKMSSIFFICYAVGQLVNGFLGDKIKAHYLICTGLAFAGISHFIIVSVTDNPFSACLLYGFTGFFLSMVYAPMTKINSENVELVYVTKCALGLQIATLLGSPVAGLLASIFDWKIVFAISSGCLFLMGLLGFAFYVYCERKELVTYNRFTKAAKESEGTIQMLFQREIVRFTIVSAVTGIIRTSVVFWLPTYISQYLGFSASRATLFYTIATVFISLSAFVAVIIYEGFKRNLHKTLLMAFSISAFAFLGAYFVKQPFANIVFMIVAILFANCASNSLWSVYCPSLRDTGMVSATTGFLNFVSYMSASVSNTIFGNAVSVVGWGKLILIWFALMAAGTVNMFPFKKNRK